MRNPVPRPLRVPLLLVLGIGLFSCARRLPRAPGPAGSTVAARGTPVRAVAPKAAKRTAPGPRMDHAKHLDKGLECADCHLRGKEDEKVLEPRPMTYEACADCHDDEDAKKPEAERVKAVFFRPDGSPAWTSSIERLDREVKWSHAAHAEVECTTCHADLAAVPRVVRRPFDMAGCMACHAQKKAPNDCATCHTVLRGDVAPPSHARDWRRTHGRNAMAATERCETCHADPAYCDRCHQRTPPASHATTGWLSAHGPAALARAERCEMCHADPQECVRCHVVTPPASHGHLWMERHGQVALLAHGRGEARCDMCHLDPNYCQRCHAIEPPRNHTHLFRTKTHGILAAIDRAKCQVCHETDFCIRCHEDTPPRSHGPLWAHGPNLHCAQCHFPIAFEGNCRTCHFEEPQHETAPDQPDWHVPGMNCRQCHTPTGNGAPPLRHIDNGTQCEFCHR